MFVTGLDSNFFQLLGLAILLGFVGILTEIEAFFSIFCMLLIVCALSLLAGLFNDKQKPTIMANLLDSMQVSENCIACNRSFPKKYLLNSFCTSCYSSYRLALIGQPIDDKSNIAHPKLGNLDSNSNLHVGSGQIEINNERNLKAEIKFLEDLLSQSKSHKLENKKLRIKLDEILKENESLEKSKTEVKVNQTIVYNISDSVITGDDALSNQVNINPEEY